MNRAWVIYIQFIAITLVRAPHRECEPQHWGPPDCTDHCHCADGDAVCSELDGHCISGICAQGWRGIPACNLPCTDTTFGLNCLYTCHCPAGDTCSKINGWCSSGKCARAWAGPSCQTRLPELSEPVEVSMITDTSVSTSWRHWDPDLDEGVGPVVYYVLEYQKEGATEWQLGTTLLESSTEGKFSYKVVGLQPNTAYRFRIVLGYILAEKWVLSVPGMPSEYIRTEIGTPTTTVSTTTMMNDTETTGNETATIDSVTTEREISTEKSTRYVTDGAGPTTTSSKTTTTTTTPKPTLPPKPVAVHLVFRNQSMLKVEWKLVSSVFKWCWNKYWVTIDKLSSSSRKRYVNKQTLETSRTHATFTDLDPASEYNITVESVPEEDVLPFTANLVTWTIPTYMYPPRSPKYVNATENKLTVMLYGIYEYDRDIKSYQVLVENITENKRTNVTGLVAAVAAGLSIKAALFYGYDQRRRNQDHPNTYVTARFDRDEVDPDGRVFTIGDDKSYGGYSNVPLEKMSEYAVWSVATYSYKGGGVTQLARSRDTFVPALLVVAPPESGGLPMAYVIAIVVAVILLLIAIAVIAGLVYKHNEEKMKYFTKFTLFRRTPVPDKHEQSTQITASTRSPTKYKPRKSLYEELDFESSGPPIHVPKAQGVVTDTSYVALRNSNPIKIEKLKKYCLERETTDYSIAEEFRHLPIGLIDTVHAATRPNNALLNRTSHILPYDSNRIKVQGIVPSGEGTDYINASLVKTHMHTFYVVTQCPMNTTMGEFWRMVWEQEISVIVALLAVDDPEKPEYKAYWPKIDDHPLLYHDVRVSCNGTERSAHYAIRTFYVSRLVGEREQIRVVRHYQFVSWTKTGVPKYTATFLDFLDRVTEGQKKNPKSMLVHCHSGGGRSGMFVAIDTLIKEGQQKGQVDVLKCVTKLRQERPNMVKHLKQYKFIYESLVDYFLCADSASDAPTFKQKYQNMSRVNKNTNNSRPQLALEFEAIENLGNLPQSPQKSPQKSILKDHSQPFISPIKKSTSFHIDDEIFHPNEEDCPKLVTAHIDSFTEPNTFLITKHPRNHQVAEFWNILAKNKCAAVVSFDSTDGGCSATKYIPDAVNVDKPVRETYGDYVVTVSEDPVVSDACVVTDVVVYPTMNPENSSFTKCFDFTNWLGHSDVPSVKHMLSLIQEVREWKCEKPGPVAVHSNRGCDRAMIFCLLWSVFEKIDLEGTVNLFRAVLHHRKFVPTTVYNACQYRFIYQCVNDYISQRPSLDVATLNDIRIEEDSMLYNQLMLHSQCHESSLPLFTSPVKATPSPTPSQLSTKINQTALNKTIQDLSTWFSNKKDLNETVLARSMSDEKIVDMPDLEEEDAENERRKKFDNKLIKLFQVKTDTKERKPDERLAQSFQVENKTNDRKYEKLFQSFQVQTGNAQ